MKSSLIVLGCFVLGILTAYFELLPSALLSINYAKYLLPIMMLFVGVSIGGDIKSLYEPIRRYRMRILYVPMATLVGTTLACLAMALLFKEMSLRQVMAVGSGYGYYSFSAIYLTELAGEEMGVMALVSNLAREISTLLFAPLMVLGLGKLAPISAAGSTSIDTSLPIISQSSGKEYVVISLFHGFVIDLFVPLIITLLYGQ